MKKVPEKPDPGGKAHDPCARTRKAIAKEGLETYGEVTPTSSCPDDPEVLCEIFKVWSADRWNGIARMVNIRFAACNCEERPPLPSPFTLDCTANDLSCDDVCEAFVEWACDYRLWALRITKAIDACFDHWSPRVKVPRVPHCESCEKTCRAMNGFHKKLARWLNDIRYPLNELCDPGGTGRVPTPPEPPPFD